MWGDPAEEHGLALVEFAVQDLTFNCGESGKPFPTWDAVRPTLENMLRAWLKGVYGDAQVDADTEYITALLDDHDSVRRVYERGRTEFEADRIASNQNGHMTLDVAVTPEGERQKVHHEEGDLQWQSMLAEARETYEECTDGGGNEHFEALVALGECPYCGLIAKS